MKRLADIAVPIAYFALCAVCLVAAPIAFALRGVARFAWKRVVEVRSW